MGDFMFKRILSVALLFLFSAHLSAYDYVVGIRAAHRQGHVRGTGVVVRNSAGEAIILTANHVVEFSSVCEISYKNGTKVRGTVFKRDNYWDAASIKAKCDVKQSFLPLAEKPPRAITTVYYIGNGPGDQVLRKSTLQGYSKYRMILQPPQSVGGDSGGPIIFNNEVVGVVTGGQLEVTSGGYFQQPVMQPVNDWGPSLGILKTLVPP